MTGGGKPPPETPSSVSMTQHDRSEDLSTALDQDLAPQERCTFAGLVVLRFNLLVSVGSV